jgi:CheY-like chemotaxis protein
MGHSYVTAMNGAEAVQQYSSSAPKYFDFVLMDVSMPVMDGFEATRQIRSIEIKRKLRASSVIVLTGLGSAEAKQTATSCGVDAFITKPVGFRQLKQTIEEHERVESEPSK